MLNEFDKVLARFEDKCATEERQRLEINKMKGELYNAGNVIADLKRQLVAIQKPLRARKAKTRRA